MNSDEKYVQLYQFSMTPMPGAGAYIAPDPNEPVPEDAEDAGAWSPVGVVPMPTGNGMSLAVIWSRPVIARKEKTQPTQTTGRLITPTAADRARLG